MSQNKPAIYAEVLSRKTSVKTNPVILVDNFPAQNSFILDPARYIDAQCSRRAGKTGGLARRFFRTLDRHPKSQCIYLGLTLESAREILWPVLQEINEQHQVGCTFLESKLTMKHPNGATLKLFGADQKNFIKRLKGRKYPGVGVDEAQDFGPHLQSLIDDVLTPSIADYPDGWIALTGTPGPVPQGYFFDVTHNKKYGFSHHEWTLMQNPFMPNPQGFLEDLIKKREWQLDNPTLLREYHNKWVLDVDSLWIRYKETVNHYTKLPEEHKWSYIMGVDIGYKDADAIAILAWSDTSPVTYLVEELITAKQGLTELVDQMEGMHKKYPSIVKVVMDEGGLGKKLAEEIRRRHGINVEPADKTRKQENVDFLNDALRLGKFMASKDSRFVKDSYLVQIDWDKTTPNRIVVKKNYHSDIIDAVLYAFKESYGFSYQPPIEKPKVGGAEWAKAQEDSMFEQALEHFEQQNSFEKWLKGD
jgi:hypothetical protein